MLPHAVSTSYKNNSDLLFVHVEIINNGRDQTFAVKITALGTNWPEQCGIFIAQGEQNVRLQILMTGIAGHENLINNKHQ